MAYKEKSNLDNSKLKSFYNSVFQKGEKKHFTKFVMNDNQSDEFSQVLKSISWKKKKVLDVGCGTGLFTFLVAKKGAKITGIDYSEKAIKIAKTHYFHPNLTYKYADLKNGIKGKFDVIVSNGTLEHTNNPFEVLKKFKKHLTKNGMIIITSPNWTNPRGYALITLLYLLDAPITKADLHYLTPYDFELWAKKLRLDLKWKTFDHSWGHGKIMIKDLRRRIPKVLADIEIKLTKTQLRNFLKWFERNVVNFDNTLPHSGAIGLYILKKK